MAWMTAAMSKSPGGQRTGLRTAGLVGACCRAVVAEPTVEGTTSTLDPNSHVAMATGTDGHGTGPAALLLGGAFNALLGVTVVCPHGGR